MQNSNNNYCHTLKQKHENIFTKYESYFFFVLVNFSPRGLSTHRGIYHNLNRKNLHKLCTNKGDSSSSTVESPMDHHQNNHSSLVASTCTFINHNIFKHE